MSLNQSKSMQQPWLTLVRLAWVVLTMNNVLPALLGLPAFFRGLLALNPPPNMAGWTQATYSAAAAQAGLAPQGATWMVMLPTLVKTLIFLGTGLLIFWWKSDGWLGLLGSYVLVGLCGTFFGGGFQYANALPPFWSAVVQNMSVVGWLAFYMFVLIFPNGRFEPRWTRWLGVSLTLWFITTLLPSLIPDWITWIGLPIILLTLFAQVQRYRRFSSPAERQQMRWFISAIGIFILYATLQLFIVRIFPLPARPGVLDLYGFLAANLIGNLVFIAIPLAIAIAIFRYHLWDIDLVIRRTLLYAALTAALGLVYFGSVVLLQQIFRAVSGQNSPAAVVLSTLAIVVIFTPLRRRLQAVIDRRFFRPKYDAALALEEFNAEARREVELERLTGLMVGVAEKTVSPEKVWVWLKH